MALGQASAIWGIGRAIFNLEHGTQSKDIAKTSLPFVHQTTKIRLKEYVAGVVGIVCQKRRRTVAWKSSKASLHVHRLRR